MRAFNLLWILNFCLIILYVHVLHGAVIDRSDTETSDIPNTPTAYSIETPELMSGTATSTRPTTTKVVTTTATTTTATTTTRTTATTTTRTTATTTTRTTATTTTTTITTTTTTPEPTRQPSPPNYTWTVVGSLFGALAGIAFIIFGVSIYTCYSRSSKND